MQKCPTRTFSPEALEVCGNHNCNWIKVITGPPSGKGAHGRRGCFRPRITGAREGPRAGRRDAAGGRPHRRPRQLRPTLLPSSPPSPPRPRFDDRRTPVPGRRTAGAGLRGGAWRSVQASGN
ncbi:hypothetical protein GCM10010515_42110 [Streptomyces fructofermentans]|uniref:Uncharacterized protein n=1 Tax=Streptomyces fructofermentans TaxID=152141 RepID=A0A918KQ11_9ACTN|nr:hypothetical protein GCM10010515_42110 [Streptomyces fructofermentans]